MFQFLKQNYKKIILLFSVIFMLYSINRVVSICDTETDLETHYKPQLFEKYKTQSFDVYNKNLQELKQLQYKRVKLFRKIRLMQNTTNPSFFHKENYFKLKNQEFSIKQNIIKIRNKMISKNYPKSSLLNSLVFK